MELAYQQIIQNQSCSQSHQIIIIKQKIQMEFIHRLNQSQIINSQIILLSDILKQQLNIFVNKMSENNQPNIEQHLRYLQETIKQKNQIIVHLQNRIKNQQKQIDLLVMDSEEKHFHQITKYYTQNYQKFMKHDRFLLIRVDDVEGNGIYLPKQAKLVHFGELQLMNPSYNPTGSIPNQENIPSLKQLNLNKNQSVSFENSCKGLSVQIQQLKQKLKVYTTIVANKSASRFQHQNREDIGTPVNRKDKEQNQGKSIKKSTQTPINKIVQYEKQKNNKELQKQQKQKQKKEYEVQNKSTSPTKQISYTKNPTDPNTHRNTINDVTAMTSPNTNTNINSSISQKTNIKPLNMNNINGNRDNIVSQFPSPSPLKKKAKTKIMFIRKN